MIQIKEQRLQTRKLLTRTEDFPIQAEIGPATLSAYVGNISLSGLLLFLKGFDHFYNGDAFTKGETITGEGYFRGLGTHFIFMGTVAWSGPLIHRSENRYAVGVAFDRDQVFTSSMIGFVMAQSEDWN